MEKPQLTSDVLVIGTQRIAVRQSSGTGPAVVLVHGNSSSSRVWQKTLEGGLGARYRLVALDLPGHGGSSDPAEAERAASYSIPGYAAVIEGVCQALSLQEAVFVGWSLGGHAVLEAMPHLPEARGFMIFGTPPLPFPPAPDFGGAFLKLGPGFVKDWTLDDARGYVADFFAPGASGDPFFLEDALRTDGNAREGLAMSVGSVGYADEVRLASASKRPLAILQGAQEQIVSRDYLVAMAPKIPALWRGQVQLVEGAGHALQWEEASAFDALLAAFVEDCQAA